VRTTLDIDDDVLQAAKERARRDGRTAGQVISDLARSALTAAPVQAATREPTATYGFRPFPKRGGLVTNEQIGRLREDDAY
jgi:hypothetical protein